MYVYNIYISLSLKIPRNPMISRISSCFQVAEMTERWPPVTGFNQSGFDLHRSNKGIGKPWENHGFYDFPLGIRWENP
jgi:hypothetical protein